jgi:hypothetical protein
MAGELDRAILAYKRSIETHPTAEAHTYLGWTYSFQGKRRGHGGVPRAIRSTRSSATPNDIGVT